MITVKNASGTIILSFDNTPLPNEPDEAYTRFPDIYGEFERYSNIPEANGVIYTPGTKVNGTSF